MPDAARFEFVSRVPRGELAGIGNRVWFVRGPSPSTHETILPLPFVHLIVNLGEPYRMLAQGGTEVLSHITGAFVSGIQSTWLLNENPPELHHVGIELAPAGLRALAGRAVGSEVVDASTLIPPLRGLPEELRIASPDAALERFESVLVSALAPGWRTPDTVVRTLAMIDENPTRRIAEMADEVGVSAKHLTAQFRSHVGITPKKYADVVRMSRFLSAVPDTPPFPGWSELVAVAGYYDQPHFIHSFTRMTGMTPQRYLESKRLAGESHFLPS